MKQKFFWAIMLLLSCVATVAAVLSCFRCERAGYAEDAEVALAELKRFAASHSLRVDDFEQPTIWVRKATQPQTDPRGRCITVCYKTKDGIAPRHILLLYLTAEYGIIDQEYLVESCEDEEMEKQR